MSLLLIGSLHSFYLHIRICIFTPKKKVNWYPWEHMVCKIMFVFLYLDFVYLYFYLHFRINIFTLIQKRWIDAPCQAATCGVHDFICILILYFCISFYIFTQKKSEFIPPAKREHMVCLIMFIFLYLDFFLLLYIHLHFRIYIFTLIKKRWIDTPCQAATCGVHNFICISVLWFCISVFLSIFSLW